MSNEKVLPATGNDDIPEEISRYYPSQLESKKIKKPLIVYLLDIETMADTVLDNNQKPIIKTRKRATLVTKPIKTKFGAKWVNVGGKNGDRYFINYDLVMNFGKHYAYLCQYGNPVGGLSFHEYPEDLTDANQVEMMVNQHTVEVFKKHKGISQKLVMIIAIIGAIGLIGTIITAQIAMGLNSQIINKNAQITNLQTQNTALQCKIDPSLAICQPPQVDGKGNVITKK